MEVLQQVQSEVAHKPLKCTLHFLKIETKWKDHSLWDKPRVQLKILRLISILIPAKVHSMLKDRGWVNNQIWNSALQIFKTIKFHHFYNKKHRKNKGKFLIKVIRKGLNLQNRLSTKALSLENHWAVVMEQWKKVEWTKRGLVSK